MKIEWQRAAAYIVAHDPQGRVLLTQFERAGHPRSGAWALPGGGMEWGEQPEDTARREFLEETGLTLEVGALLGVQSGWIEPGRFGRDGAGHAVRIIFKGHAVPGPLRTDFTEDDTTAAAAWFSPTEVVQLDRVDVVDFGLRLARG